MARDRKAMKAALLKRTAESDRTKNDSGKFGNIFIDDLDVDFWKCKEGEHLIDIIPYEVGKNHPTVAEGESDYKLDIWVHYKVGPNEDAVICMARTKNGRCPICEHQNKMRKDESYTDDDIKKLNPKRRCIYNILCYDSTKEEQAGVMLWDASHFSVESNILAIARRPRGGGLISFSDPDEGKSILFTREGSGALNTKYVGFRLEEREVEVSDAALDEALTLDEVVIWPDYDEVKEKFLAGLSEDDADEKPGRRKKDDDEDEKPRRRRTEEDEDEDASPSRRRRLKKDDAEEDEEEEKPRRRRKAEPEEEEEEEKPRRGRRKAEPEEEPEEDEEEEKPRRRRKPEPEPEEEPEEEEEEKPRRRKLRKPEKDDEEDEKPKKKSSGECPHGGEFGTDLDELDQCNKCKVYDDCAAAKEAAEEEKPKRRRRG